MNKKIIIINALAMFFCSCNLDQEKNEKLEKELISYKKQYALLKDQYKNIVKQNDSINNIVTQKFIDREYLDFFVNNTYKYSLNKRNLVTFVFNKIGLNKNDVLGELWNNGLFSFYNFENNAEITSKSDFFTYLWFKIDRSPEFITSFLSNEDKKYIYTLFENNSFYKDSGLEAMVKGLLISYEQVENNPELLQKIYKLAKDEKEYVGDTVDFIEGELDIFDVSSVLDDINYSTYPNESKRINRIGYVYKFWARRYEEDNKEAVYNLLKELHSNLSKENIKAEDSDISLLPERNG
ncbi:hypothetical protein [Tenacibaculum sp. SDUM215027]|uniref:hypothetical protein n=1 Tax=Tenacibaculum sp. SDUM215027 TaxID=3422596 RepID=UPI003D3149E2